MTCRRCWNGEGGSHADDCSGSTELAGATACVKCHRVFLVSVWGVCGSGGTEHEVVPIELVDGHIHKVKP